MGKAINIVKKLVFAWGLISLGLFLSVTIYVMISSMKDHQAAEKDGQETIYEKSFDRVKLQVNMKSKNESNDYLLILTESGKPLITDYRLPFEKYGMDFLEIEDSKVIPVNGNEYRIILYSAMYDCDQVSASYIWLLKLKEQMNLVKVFEISGMHVVNGKETIIFGNKLVNLPYIDEKHGYKHFTVPVEIQIGDSIKTMPMLNQKGLDLMKGVIEKEAKVRMENLTSASNSETLGTYKTSMEHFNDAIAEKVIPY